MTTIRTTCSRCGDVELTIADIGLELIAEDATGITGLPVLRAETCIASPRTIGS